MLLKEKLNKDAAESYSYLADNTMYKTIENNEIMKIVASIMRVTLY